MTNRTYMLSCGCSAERMDNMPKPKSPRSPRSKRKKSDSNSPVHRNWLPKIMPSGRIALEWDYKRLGPKSHPQVQCSKTFSCDKRMKLVVDWLNSFSSLYTLYCCESEGESRPYVIFKCDNQEDLIAVVRTFNDVSDVDANIHLNYINPTTGMRYILYFTGQGDLDRFSELVKRAK